MSTTFLQKGEVLTLTAPAGGVVAGTAYLIGAILVVARETVAQGLPFDADVCGVHVLPKAAGALAEGASVYWDNAAKNVTATPTANYYIGVATAAALAGDATVPVRLNGIGIKAAG